ncbi:MAG: hypothetical protein RR645_02270 [Clostridium sp.]
MSIKKQRFFLKIALTFIFTFVVLGGYNIDLKNTTVYETVGAKELLTARSKSSGGFKSGGFSSRPSSGYKSGGFKSNSTNGSSKGYNSGSFKNSNDASKGGYGSGSFKESSPKVDTTPKGDTSKNYNKGGSGAYPVPIPVRGFSPFGFNFFGGYFMMKYIMAALVITLIVIAGVVIYRKLRNRRQ